MEVVGVWVETKKPREIKACNFNFRQWKKSPWIWFISFYDFLKQRQIEMPKYARKCTFFFNSDPNHNKVKMICQNNTCQIINSHAIMRVKVTHKWGATLVAAKMVSTHQFQNKKGLIIFVCLQFTELTTRKLLWTFSKFYGRVLGILCILVITFLSHLKKKLHLVKISVEIITISQNSLILCILKSYN